MRSQARRPTLGGARASCEHWQRAAQARLPSPPPSGRCPGARAPPPHRRHGAAPGPSKVEQDNQPPWPDRDGPARGGAGGRPAHCVCCSCSRLARLRLPAPPPSSSAAAAAAGRPHWHAAFDTRAPPTPIPLAARCASSRRSDSLLGTLLGIVARLPRVLLTVWQARSRRYPWHCPLRGSREQLAPGTSSNARARPHRRAGPWRGLRRRKAHVIMSTLG